MPDLLTIARADAQDYLSGDWSGEIIFNDNQVVRGLITKHHLKLNPDTGTAINDKNAHIAVTEAELIAAGITVRNANEEIDLIEQKVSMKDSSGVLKHYLIDETYPSETLGIIVCILGDFE